MIIIDHKSDAWKIWSTFIIIISSVSSFYYGYLAAYPVRGVKTEYDSLSKFFELMFLIDFLARFILSYPKVADDPNSPVETDLTKIFENYAKGEGIIDLISLLPFIIFDFDGKEDYLFILKICRLRRGIRELDVGNTMAAIHEYQMRYLKKNCEASEEFANETSKDLCYVKEILIFSYVIKTLRLMVLISVVSYFFAMIFKIVLEIE